MMVSDDTVMHLATGEALLEHGRSTEREKVFSILAQKYKDCMHDMQGRAPGKLFISLLQNIQSFKTFRRGS